MSFNNPEEDTLATTTEPGIIEIATPAEINTGTDNDKAISPDSLAGSNLGTKSFCIVVTPSDTAVSVADGTSAFVVPASLNGMNIVDVVAGVYTKGVTATTDVQVRKERGAVSSDVLSTKVTLGDEYFARDGVIDTSEDDLTTGDSLYVDVDAVHSGTAPNGLSVTITAQLP